MRQPISGTVRDYALAAMAVMVFLLAFRIYRAAPSVVSGLNQDTQAANTVLWDAHAQRPAVNMLLTHAIPSMTANIAAMTKTVAQIGADERNNFSAQQATANELAAHSEAVLDAGRTALTTFNTEIGNLHPAIVNLNRATAAAADMTPQLDATLAELHGAAQHTNATMGHAENISASGERVAAHYEKVATAPVSVVKRIYGFVLYSLGKYTGW